MPIQELARDTVVTANRGTLVHELARQMRETGVGSVVITDEDKPVGIVTDRDLTIRVLVEETAPNHRTAEDVMSTDLWTVDPDAGFYEAAEVMSEHAIRRLPVCDEDDELLGIITADDLTELLAGEQAQLASVIQAQEPSY